MSQNSNVKHTLDIVNTVGQVGCVIGVVAVVVIGISFALGWWIDGLLGNERKWVTIIMMLGSFPISLYLMIQISLRTLARAQARSEALQKQAENQREEDKNV